MANKTKKLDLESSLAELDKLVGMMESGKLSLEESLRYFEQGIKLSQRCQKTLREAEQKVTMLIEKNGETILTPYEDNE